MGLWCLGAARLFDGAHDEGAELAERAVAVDPLDPYVHLYSRTAGLAHLAADRPDRAAEWLRRADQLAPEVAPNLIALCAAHVAAGEIGPAREALGNLMAAAPDFRLSLLSPPPFRDRATRDIIPAALTSLGAPR